MGSEMCIRDSLIILLQKYYKSLFLLVILWVKYFIGSYVIQLITFLSLTTLIAAFNFTHPFLPLYGSVISRVLSLFLPSSVTQCLASLGSKSNEMIILSVSVVNGIVL